jgi:hypothetical protein
VLAMNKGLGRAVVMAAFLAGLASLSGCASIGPGRMLQDRTDYDVSLTESWKRQILLNIVKIRYVEPVFFVEVGDIVAGYTMETGGNFGLTRSMYDQPTPITTNNNPVLGNFGRIDLGVTGRYTDRPTVTYKPMTGTPFRRGVMSPMPLRNIMAGLDSGISAQFLFSLGVRSINGLRNAALTAQGQMPAQPGFRRVVDIMAQLQLHNALRVKIEQEPGKETRICLVLGGRNPAPEAKALTKELLELLDLDPSLREYELISGPETGNRGQIAIQTYSMMQIMAAVAARVDVPLEDITAKKALPGAPEAPGEGLMGAVAVRNSATKPQNAYAAVNFHGHCFWVDDADLPTKKVFSFLMLAFTLMEDKSPNLPVQMTIPLQ